MFSGPFWEYLNSLSWVSVMIYVAKVLVSLHPCVLETLDRIFREYGSNQKMFNFLTLF